MEEEDKFLNEAEFKKPPSNILPDIIAETINAYLRDNPLEKAESYLMSNKTKANVGQFQLLLIGALKSGNNEKFLSIYENMIKETANNRKNVEIKTLYLRFLLQQNGGESSTDFAVAERKFKEMMQSGRISSSTFFTMMNAASKLGNIPKMEEYFQLLQCKSQTNDVVGNKSILRITKSHYNVALNCYCDYGEKEKF